MPKKENSKVSEEQDKEEGPIEDPAEEDNEEYIVQCIEHGKQGASLACHHLLTCADRGFYCADPRDGDEFPDAWCAECDSIFQEEGSWNKRALELAGFGVICNGCYPKAKERNQISVFH